MKEQLITFETAKLAKEKGFDTSDKYGIWLYDLEDRGLVYMNDITYRTNKLINGLSILAPTQSLLQKWLREKHNIHIKIHSSNADRFSYEIYRMIIRNVNNDRDFKHIHNKISLSTYEEALEEGLQEALNLIK